MSFDFDTVVEKAFELGASDIHLTVGLPPIVRVSGRLIRLGEENIEADDTDKFVRGMLKPEQLAVLVENGEYDCSISIKDNYRFRMNCFRKQGVYAVALRKIDSDILTLEQLGLPANLRHFTDKTQGIVLVTGPTGSGKTTTLAALIDIINTERDCHILCLEDPIEFIHKHKMSIVNQREIGSDSKNYPSALRAALREDPDVILIGEMRDHESIAIALTAAETGHLVFSTLHTISAAKAIDRIIDVFPPSQQQQIRFQLSITLLGVVAQQLIPRASGKGRRAAAEVMFCTPAIRNLIREAKTPQINNAIMSGTSFGMVSMDNSLIKLYKTGEISQDELMHRCIDDVYVRQNISEL